MSLLKIKDKYLWTREASKTTTILELEDGTFREEIWIKGNVHYEVVTAQEIGKTYFNNYTQRYEPA